MQRYFDKKHMFNLLKIIYLLILLNLGRSLIAVVRDLWYISRETEIRENEIALLKEEKLNLEEKLKSTSSDKVIEELARKKLGMKKKNETIYRIVK